MKDILLINMFSKSECPYDEHYIKELDKKGITYDVLYFERYDMDFISSENELVFKKKCPTGGKKLKKIFTMIRYAKFIRKIVKRGEYKGIIVFATNPAIMIFDLLLRKYKGKYIIDIRDYTSECNKLFFRIESKVIHNAYATVISSRGFLRFLPANENYIVTHNIPIDDIESYNSINLKFKQHYVIGFVGSIRYYKENIALINQFKNSEEFELSYNGSITNECDLEKYCKDMSIVNVHFTGRFDNKRKGELYQNIDLINSIYGIEGLETTTAVPNRLYDACIYGCPIIVSEGTFLAELVKEYKLGIVVNVFSDNIKKILEEYIDEFDEEEFLDNCQRFLTSVRTDMEKQKNVINQFSEYICIC